MLFSSLYVNAGVMAILQDNPQKYTRRRQMVPLNHANGNYTRQYSWINGHSVSEEHVRRCEQVFRSK